MIKIITAYSDDKLIGKGDKLPWNIPEELAFFKEETMGKTILMGDVTFKGLPGILPGRKTIVLTLDKTYTNDNENVEVIYSIEEVLERYQDSEEELYVCGGATIYGLFLPLAKEIIVSHIKGKYNGEVYFPEWDDSFFTKEEILENAKFTTVKYIKK